MRHPWIYAVVFGLALALGMATAQAATPKEAVGFRGTATGAVVSAQADGLAFVLKVEKAEAAENSKAKDPAAMVGKAITLGVRMPRKDGKPYPSPEDVAYIKSLKPGMEIRIKVFAVFSSPRVLRMQGPGEPVKDEG